MVHSTYLVACMVKCMYVLVHTCMVVWMYSMMHLICMAVWMYALVYDGCMAPWLYSMLNATSDLHGCISVW